MGKMHSSMKRVLFTGSSGFIGRNICPNLKKKCVMFTPQRHELDLNDELEVRTFIIKNKINIIIHAANPNPARNNLDSLSMMCEESIRMFMNLYNAQDCYERMYTLGSGAEFDKTKDIISISESDEFRSIPKDTYGFAKFVINKLVFSGSNQYNLRLFAVYGPTDHESKFITHAIRCCLAKEDITIRQNCLFDYLHVSDLGKIIEILIDKKLHYKTYNLCSGSKISLYDIATEVKKQMKSKSNIVVMKSGMNKEYTGCNQRLLNEIGSYSFKGIQEGIAEQIDYEKSIWRKA